MSAICPVCGERIPAYKVKGHMWCVSCGSELSAPTVAPMLGFFVLWSIVDLFVMIVVGAAIPDREGIRVIVHILISVGVGIGLFWLIYSNVAIKSTGQKRDDAG